MRQLIAATRTAAGILKYRDEAIVRFLIDTAGRADELLRFTEEDFDRANREIVLHRKGAREMRVNVGPKTMRAIDVWLKARPIIPGRPVWTTHRSRTMTYSTLHAMLKRLGESCEPPIRDMQPHRFRRTAAVEFHRAHRDIRDTRDFLGHADVGTTEIYLRSLGVDEFRERKLRTPGEWLG